MWAELLFIKVFSGSQDVTVFSSCVGPQGLILVGVDDGKDCKDSEGNGMFVGGDLQKHRF
jgi:hypothetical protein